MNCSDFLAGFTDFLDGATPPEERVAMDRHLRRCASCRRYRAVVESGAKVLRSLPEPTLREDFEPRLRHRIYHVDDERALRAHQSATPALTVLGIAILLTALAWAPVLRGAGGDIVLEPIVIDRRPSRDVPLQPVVLTPPGSFSTKTPADLDDGLFENALLYDYSALSQRYQQRARVRRVADFDR